MIERGKKMKQVTLMSSIILLLLSALPVFAQPIIINIDRLTEKPSDFGTGRDRNINDLSPFDVAGLSPGTESIYRFHVNIDPGITDLHITVIPGPEPPIQLTQNLFDVASVSGLQADLSGQLVPRSTYFTLDTNVSLRLTPTAIPEPSTFLLVASGIVILLLYNNSGTFKRLAQETKDEDVPEVCAPLHKAMSRAEGLRPDGIPIFSSSKLTWLRHHIMGDVL